MISTGVPVLHSNLIVRQNRPWFATQA